MQSPDAIQPDGRRVHALGWHYDDLRDFEFRLVVRGPPMTLKNHKQIVALPKQRPILVLGPAARKWLKTATDQLQAQWSALFKEPIPGHLMVSARMLVFCETRRRADLSNLYQAPEDAMQAAGVLEDDYQIASHDGSRRLHDPADPRVEITLTPYDHDGQAEPTPGLPDLPF